MYRRDVWMIIKGFFTLVGKLFTGRLRREGLESGERLVSAAGAGHAAAAARRAAGKLCGKPFGRKLGPWACCCWSTARFCSCRISCPRVGNRWTPPGPGKALLVGVVQMVAIFPGISRSGSTITGGLFAGFRREDAVRFSFLLSIPAILGANLLKLPDLFETGLGGESALPMLLGVAAALLSGIAAIRLLRYITKNKSFTPFSIYCALAGAAVIAADPAALTFGRQGL